MAISIYQHAPAATAPPGMDSSPRVGGIGVYEIATLALAMTRRGEASVKSTRTAGVQNTTAISLLDFDWSRC